ncbi:MAG: hypothetical protein ACREIA_20540 [Opitutaceae bacterium]
MNTLRSFRPAAKTWKPFDPSSPEYWLRLSARQRAGGRAAVVGCFGVPKALREEAGRNPAIAAAVAMIDAKRKPLPRSVLRAAVSNKLIHETLLDFAPEK